MAAEVLIKKGKRGAAAYFQSECARSTSPQQLNELLDIVLDPRKPIDLWDTIDWCKWLMAGGKTPDEFAQTVRRYDNATTCGLVWTANFVAYRCRTCGISPCMSLCADCFQQGNHEGHDFNMFRSQAGGACDCGDSNVMKEAGFCQRHGPKAQMGKLPAPPDLLCVAESMMPRVIFRLAQHLREYSTPADATSVDLRAIQKADGFLTMLHQLSEMGAAMRQVMTHALTNPHTYKTLTSNFDSCDPEKAHYLRKNFQQYEEAKKMLKNWESPAEYQEIKSLQPNLEHATFLEELVFWMVKLEFPQKLVCFLLNMLPDIDYKEAFTRTFVHHYSRISYMLTQSGDSETLSNRIVHVSVQLFSNEGLSFRMTKYFHLLHVMVISLKAMMSLILHPSTLQDSEKNFHYVVNCGHRITKDHCYWPLVSDLNNILTHKRVALEFLSDIRLLDMWFSLLSMFQGMNVNHRELVQHVEFEPNTYYAAFSAELEASATPLWALVSHLKNEETLPLSKNVLEHCLSALEDFFNAISFFHTDVPSSYQVSFHLPLHRYYSVFLCQAVLYQGATLIELLPDRDTLQLLMAHPLQAMISFYEILNGMWVRNGLQIKGQAMTYIQCHFCNSMVDADLFLLQLCCTHLDPDWVVKTTFQRFHMWEWLSFVPDQKNSFLEPDKVYLMLESSLTFFATLINIHTNLGMTEEEVTRQEMITLLCMGDRTHSQLMDLLPEKCGNSSQNKDFETFLAQVADYKAPNFEAGGNMLQGMYVPKPHIWETEYDPIHVLLRAVHRRDFQASMDRFTQYVRQAGNFKGNGPPWPPLRIPGKVHPELLDPRLILQCKTLHAVLFVILYRALSDPEISEQTVALAVYLLEMAVEFHQHSVSPKDSLSVIHEVSDLNLGEWFSTSCVIHNSMRKIKSIVLMEPMEVTESVVEEMEVDKDADVDFEELFEVPSYQVYSPVPEDENAEHGVSHPRLPSSSHPLALPPSSASTALVPATSGGPVVSHMSNHASGSPQSIEALSLPGPSHVVPITGSEGNNGSDTSGPMIPISAMCLSGSMQYPSSSSSSSSPPPSLPAPASPPPAIQFTSTGQAVGTDLAIVPSMIGAPTLKPRYLHLRPMNKMRGLLHRELLLPNPSNHAVEGGETMKALPSSNRLIVELNESILSILLKLHSKLSGKPDSYKPLSERQESSEGGRVGDGPFFISKLLDKICQKSGGKETPIQELRAKIWPPKEPTQTAPSSGQEAVNKEERRRRAKERQMKLMAEFASRQKSFLQKAMETEQDDSSIATETEEKESVINIAKEYECVICSQSSPSTQVRMIGMVVLLQSTSVLGHAHQVEVGPRKLPCSDEQKLILLRETSRASHMKKRFEELTRHFDDNSWSQSVNIGWEGGVHVQSCGHYLHIDCHKAYMQSQRQSQHNQRQQVLAVDKGEYFCPLCRQLANSVLPIHPDMGELMALVKCSPQHLPSVAQELSNLMSGILSPVPTVLKAMKSFMEDLQNATFVQYRSPSFLQGTCSLLLFLYSIARTNLEIELTQRGGSLFNNQVVKKSCFVPLFHALALHVKVVTNTPHSRLWSHLTGLSLEDNLSSLAPLEKEVPLLLRDVSSILLQILLTLPLNVDKAYYTCIVKVLFNLCYVQAIAQISFKLVNAKRSQYKQDYVESKEPLNSLGQYFGLVVDHLENCSLYLEDTDFSVRERLADCQDQDLEERIKTLCLPFVRIAALLQAHLYNESLPSIQNKSGEFGVISEFLDLSSTTRTPTLITNCLNWATPDPQVLIRTWCQDYINFANKSVIAARNLLEWPVCWNQPSLLRLPETYDQIFQYYHSRTCTVCHSVPKDPSVCLVCGTMVCLRENCCKQQTNFYEAVHHSINCGAGTAMFLAVNSSTVIVIRGKRACLWGSVYLDSFGEEDRDLKRGKPLYLSVDRYRLLEHQWLNHSFDHTPKRWVWHKDNL